MRNLFKGDSYYVQFAKYAYERLMTQKPFSYADVMADFNSCSRTDGLESGVSNSLYYGELKKAFPDLCKAICQKCGNGCIQKRGNNRNRTFLYVGEDKDPLSDMRNAVVIKDIKRYWNFCQNSAGFFPMSWLEYFFRDSRDLIDIKNRRHEGEQVLSASLDRMLTNIDLLPCLYKFIVNRKVISVRYKPYDEEERELTFHPHYLKEFNGRWHLLGHAEGQEPDMGYNIALDRICGKPREMEKTAYLPAPKGFYEEFFRNIVGVSHLKQVAGRGNMPQHIQIRAHQHYIFMLTETKKIHPSQTVAVPYGPHDDGEYGDFDIYVEVNNELIGRILQMGDGLEVMAPQQVRELVAHRISLMYDRYRPKNGE